MSQTTGRTRLLAFAGITLVAIGAWLLLERVLGPLMYPLHAALHALGALVWPLALIAVGVAIIGRGRLVNGIGGVFRSRSERVVGGVLGGVATRLGVDSWIVRIAYVAFTLLTGVATGLVLYVAAMILLPEEPLTATSVPPAPPVPNSATSAS